MHLLHNLGAGQDIPVGKFGGSAGSLVGVEGSGNSVEGEHCCLHNSNFAVVVEGYSSPAEGLHGAVEVEGSAGSLAGLEADCNPPVEGVYCFHSNFVVAAAAAAGNRLAGVEGCHGEAQHLRSEKEVVCS